MQCPFVWSVRYGFTTGSCAAAAAKAAAYMLLTGRIKREISIKTPKGITYTPKLCAIQRSESEVSCGVVKDGGDDPDVTTGAHICARAACQKETEEGEKLRDRGRARIIIEGGFGVGRVTKPGLDQPVGSAAINHVPREMIEREVREVCELLDFWGTLLVTIFVPEGVALAEKTFNPRLGIVGGISILGTSGIVEPMSSQALLDTIRVELNQRRAEGAQEIAVSPGNYGLEYMQRVYGYNLDKSVKCSNFIGDTIDMARELGYRALLLTGHIGKLVKVSGGIMNTHSREGDCRMELIAAAVIRTVCEIPRAQETDPIHPAQEYRVPGGVLPEILSRILGCATTEEAVHILDQYGLREQVMTSMIERIHYYLNQRGQDMQVECILYANDYGELARTAGANELLERIKGVG